MVVSVTRARLPTELLALVANLAHISTLSIMAMASCTAYAVSIRPLYESIPYMDRTRTIQCLNTLASNSQLARLVHIYAIKELNHATDSSAVCELLGRALMEMVNLTELSIQLGRHGTSRIFEQTSFKLRKLICIIDSDPVYSISRFLNSQSQLDSLYLVCRPSGLSDLSPTALPLLQEIAAPLCLLPSILPRRLDQVTQISVLGTITTSSELHKLAGIFRGALARPIVSTAIELVLGLDLSARTMSLEDVEVGLAVLGMAVPSIELLRIEVHQGRVEQGFLLDTLTSVLHHYPYIRTLVIISQPRRCAYIQPDGLHNTTYHNAYLDAWRKACPGLERVVFPIGIYTYDEKRKGSDKICLGEYCPTCYGLLAKVRRARMLRSGSTREPSSSISV